MTGASKKLADTIPILAGAEAAALGKEKKPRLRPLCVDLDGTLVRTDTLVESATQLLRSNPLYLIWLPLWLMKGIAYLKFQIARHTNLDVSILPYNKQLLSYLMEEKRRGRKLYLVTGANRIVAERVQDYLGIFEGVLASSEKVNLVGRKKASVLVKKFGKKRFAYAGNSEEDFYVWRVCSEAVIVNAPSWIEAKARLKPEKIKIYSDRKSSLRIFLKAIRIHQCTKNILLFVPIFLANRWLDIGSILITSAAFLIFTMCTSGVYLLNDIFDLDADRKHPENKKRPLASGDLSLRSGLILAPLFLGTGLILAAFLSPKSSTARGPFLPASEAATSIFFSGA